ncbi:MAG: tyrosine-type recombinase/integrase [Verrucomicrobiota bacterium]
MAIPNKRFVRPMLGFLSVAEMQAILHATGKSWTGQRDHLLFLFLYNTGARVSEALSTRVQDVQRHDYRARSTHGQRAKATHGPPLEGNDSPHLQLGEDCHPKIRPAFAAQSLRFSDDPNRRPTT